MNLWIVGAGLLGLIILQASVRSVSKRPQTASVPQIKSLPTQEERAAKISDQRAPSNEIPIPDDFEYRHRGGQRISEKQRRARLARRKREAEIQETVLKQLRLEAELQRKAKLQQYTKVSRARLPRGYSKEWVDEQRNRQTGLCFWCSKELSETKNHLDHVWPLSLGGHHDVANIVIACSPCNLDKGSQNPWDFIDRLQARISMVVVKSGDDSLNSNSIIKDQENKLAGAKLREDLRFRLSEMGITEAPNMSRQTAPADTPNQLELDFKFGVSYSVVVQDGERDVLTLFDID